MVTENSRHVIKPHEIFEALRLTAQLLQGFDFSTDASDDTTELLCELHRKNIQEAFQSNPLLDLVVSATGWVQSADGTVELFYDTDEEEKA